MPTHSETFFGNENIWIEIEVSMKYVSESPVDNNSAKFQVMAGRHLPHEWWPMPALHICVIRPQWDNRDMQYVVWNMATVLFLFCHGDIVWVLAIYVFTFLCVVSMTTFVRISTFFLSNVCFDLKPTKCRPFPRCVQNNLNDTYQSSHTVPHSPSCNTSTRPSVGVSPPTRRISTTINVYTYMKYM